MEGLRPRTRLLAVAALAAVGALFVWKYGARATPHAGALALLFAATYGFAVTYAQRTRVLVSARAFRWAGVALVIGALALALLVPEANRVARLPALAVWLDRLAAGHFPYGSPIRPSGFPGLYALALPFWAVGALRMLPVLGLAVFFAVARYVEPDRRLAVVAGVALLPPIYYEAAVHSELFLNVALALASLWVFERARVRGGSALIGAAVLAGLLLSTRLVVGVVYAVYGTYAFRSAWGRGLAFAAVALATWTATWLPFALWEPATFAALGPFSIQGLYLPGWAMPAGAATALALGWYAPALPDVVSRAGWLLLALVGLSFGITLAEVGLASALRDGFDLAYFILPTPFLLLALGFSDASRTLTP